MRIEVAWAIWFALFAVIELTAWLGKGPTLSEIVWRLRDEDLIGMALIWLWFTWHFFGRGR